MFQENMSYSAATSEAVALLADGNKEKGTQGDIFVYKEMTFNIFRCLRLVNVVFVYCHAYFSSSRAADEQ